MTWQDDAACKGTDPDDWFPGRGEPINHLRALCASCPVSGECLEYAVVNRIRFGIWGGRSERERRRMWGQLAPTPNGCVECGAPIGRKGGQKVCSDSCDRRRKSRLRSVGGLAGQVGPGRHTSVGRFLVDGAS